MVYGRRRRPLLVLGVGGVGGVDSTYEVAAVPRSPRRVEGWARRAAWNIGANFPNGRQTGTEESLLGRPGPRRRTDRGRAAAGPFGDVSYGRSVGTVADATYP